MGKHWYRSGPTFAERRSGAALGLVAFVVLTFVGGEAFAEDEQVEASQLENADARAPSVPCVDPQVCPIAKARPMPKIDSTPAQELASEVANPSAPVMALRSFLDITTHGGSAPGARRASFQYAFQPPFPFPTKRGNVILRPLIPVLFGAPFLTTAGNVETAVAFGNILLDSVYGATLKNGLLIMGGFITVFPSSSKRELRADWALGPDLVLGYASPKTGSIVGTVTQFTWSFPTRPRGQTVGGQYFYAVNLGKGWQFAATPVWSYSRETKVLRFPIGIGLQRVSALGKKKQPVQFGVQMWGYAPPPDALGPQWTLRFTVAPIVPIPWKK